MVSSLKSFKGVQFESYSINIKVQLPFQPLYWRNVLETHSKIGHANIDLGIQNHLRYFEVETVLVAYPSLTFLGYV